MSKLNKFVLWIQEKIMIFTSLVIAAMILMSAIMRYVFHSDFYGMEEIVIILAFWLYFMGSSYAAYEDSHIKADLLSSMAKTKKTKAILSAIKNVLSLLISLLVTKWCLGFIIWNIKMNPKSPVYGIPLLISQIPILISFVLMTIYIFTHLVNDVNELKNNK